MTLWETVMSFSVHTEGSVEYQVGDMVVYPRHGAARVEEISERTVKGVTRQYLRLVVLSSDGLEINVPVDNVKKKLASETLLERKKLQKFLRFCVLQ